MALDPSQIHILIVDDDPLLLETFSSLFAQFKFNVKTAVNGQEALDQLQLQNFNLVLSDIRMPVMDGIELLVQVKNRFAPDLCVLLTSGYSGYALDMIYDLGVDGFFDKPASVSSVRDSIRRALIAPQERWKADTTKAPQEIKYELHAKFKNADELFKNSNVAPGRGGFYWTVEKSIPPVRSAIRFKIEFEDHSFEPIEGAGLVRWSRSITESDKPSAVGFEIMTLKDHSLAWYPQHLLQKKLIPFIPARAAFINPAESK